ncbi:MAG: chemotaxis protein CheW [Nitrospinota bacterium]|nr:chemotaxis protein CheW [Nitrospinota bacterium]MDH5679658.1 chemotaxis protein CheW [Nitrospinota bacterium]MDH5755092.1 chemotaxis protein CheW [Nitrospinota bacterium]
MSKQSIVAEVETERKIQLCTFRLNNRLFGVDIQDVKEINTEVGFTRIFHAPREVRGYVNIRGQIHLVLDLRTLLGFAQKDPDHESRVVIFKQNIGEPFGALVDKIGDIVEVGSEDIEEYGAQDDAEAAQEDRWKNRNLVVGVCKLEKDLLVILNARSFLKTFEQK